MGNITATSMPSLLTICGPMVRVFSRNSEKLASTSCTFQVMETDPLSSCSTGEWSAWAAESKSVLISRLSRLYNREVNLTIELDREDDGRWIAEARELPGVMCYGLTRYEAISNTERLAIEVIADRIAHGELPSSALGVSFSIPDEHFAIQ